MKIIRKSILNQHVRKAVECGNFGSGWCCNRGTTGFCCNK